MALGELSFFWKILNDVTGRLNERNKNTAEAIGAIRKAFLRTYDYLRHKNGEYVPNAELADLWNEASTKVMIVDARLGDMLAVKSRFWGDPDLYFRLNQAENVLELTEITDEMERLRHQIK